jgi:hypothetical protein
MCDIFISYSHHDKEVAERYAHSFERKGWTVFWDKAIPPGKTYDHFINEQLQSARCIVVLWSGASVVSDWVKEEAQRGVRRGNLVPIMIEVIDPPLGFGRIEAAELVNWQGDSLNSEYINLLKAIEATLAMGSPAAPPADSSVKLGSIGKVANRSESLLPLEPAASKASLPSETPLAPRSPSTSPAEGQPERPALSSSRNLSTFNGLRSMLLATSIFAMAGLGVVAIVVRHAQNDPVVVPTPPPPPPPPPPTTTTPPKLDATVSGDPGTKNLRSGPGTKYDVVGTVQTGESVTILAKSFDTGGYSWVKVLTASGQTAWIAGHLLNYQVP